MTILIDELLIFSTGNEGVLWGIGTRVQIVIQVIRTTEELEHMFEGFSITTRLLHNSIMLVDILLNMEDL